MTHTRIIGKASSQPEASDHSASALVPQRPGRFLLSGTRLHEFEIIDVLAAGGFGVVYRAQDHSLDRRVAIKEYMPATLAERTQGVTVSPIAGDQGETFQAGLHSFVNEARLLAHFDHPALIKVYRFWEANGTAYMAMPLLAGKTLQATLAEMGELPGEAWLTTLLMPLLDGLEVLHNAQCLHRDIAPDNILILPDGKPLLLDFGAARRVIGDRTQALTVILKPGYAPPEQYVQTEDARQGAWTDIYAMAGVLYFAMTGTAPMTSVARMMGDVQVKLALQKPPGFSLGLLAAVDQALALDPHDRPQSVAEWRRLLAQHPVAGTTDGATAASKAQPVPPGAVTAVGAGGNRKLGLGLVVLVLSLMAGYLAWTTRTQEDQTQEKPIETLPVKSQKVVTANESAPASVFEPMKELGRVFDQRDPTWGVRVWADSNSVRIGRDKLRFRVSSDQSGYVYVMMVGTNQSDFSLIFPNELDGNNRIQAGGEIRLPGPGWAMTADGPAGRDEFLAIVSKHPRDFSLGGMLAAPPFAQFSPERALAALKQAPGDRSPLAGAAVCVEKATCNETYGAATLSIREEQ